MTQTNKATRAKMFLRRYRYLKSQKRAIERTIAEDLEKAANVSPQLSPGGKGGGDPQKMASAVIRAVDEGQTLERIQREIDAALSDIERAVGSVKGETERAVLRLRYICGWSWEDIQAEICYERSQCFEIHKRALRDVEKWMRRTRGS